jgi:hypothetical protein
MRKGENVARWRGFLDKSGLPKRLDTQPTQHFAAMRYDDVPEFMRELRARNGVGPRALEFLILCPSTTNEALGASL